MNTKLYSIHLLKPVSKEILEHLNSFIRDGTITVRFQTQSSKMIFILLETTEEDYTFLKLKYENLMLR